LSEASTWAALEPREAIRIERKGLRQHLFQRDITFSFWCRGLKTSSHAAFAELAQDPKTG
jgi:hypothetical protein